MIELPAGARCQALIQYFGFLVARCPEPAVGVYRFGCVHEHTNDKLLCVHHTDQANIWCTSCLEGDTAHDCAVIVRPLVDRSAAAFLDNYVVNSGAGDPDDLG